MRKLALVWGVHPILGTPTTNTDDMLENAVAESTKHNIVNPGDLVIITAGVPVNESGTTNIMKIHIIGSVLVSAQGIGRKSASGKVVVAKNAAEAIEKATEGCILVTNASDRDMMPAIEKCAALVTEEGGLTSHAAVVGLSQGIPVIVGAKNATAELKDGQVVTVHARSGRIYEGHSSIL